LLSAKRKTKNSLFTEIRANEQKDKEKILKKSIGYSKIVVAQTTKKERVLCSILMISK
jgi:hypothetical protein